MNFENSMTPSTLSYKEVFSALSYAAIQHRYQRRKGFNSIPYINHPIGVAGLIVNVASVNDILTIQGALLHDVVEDTGATLEDIKQHFGSDMMELVKELTDDTSLSSKKRKEIQAETAPQLSDKAKMIRIADKVCNLEDLMNYPMGWPRKRKINYVKWSVQVYQGCKGVNENLDTLFQETVERAMDMFQKSRK
jgi:guanosine-3',5'-bis(diphosphate) 3'-pyrophosphohydrolase